MLGLSFLVLGAGLMLPPAHCSYLLLLRVLLPLALVQVLLLSTSLRVLPVVLPYGRLRHAVLPQGRTTDRMLGLPLRLRIPICLCGPGSKARMVPVPVLLWPWGGLLGEPVWGGSRCVYTQPEWYLLASMVLQVGPPANRAVSWWCRQKPFTNDA